MSKKKVFPARGGLSDGVTEFLLVAINADQNVCFRGEEVETSAVSSSCFVVSVITGSKLKLPHENFLSARGPVPGFSPPALRG